MQWRRPSKGSDLLHCAALNQSDLCQEHLSRNKSLFGLAQWFNTMQYNCAQNAIKENQTS